MPDETAEITVGTIVVLKSGSVAMEVTDITGLGVDQVASCAWENRAGAAVVEVHPLTALELFDGTNAVPEPA